MAVSTAACDRAADSRLLHHADRRSRVRWPVALAVTTLLAITVLQLHPQTLVRVACMEAAPWERTMLFDFRLPRLLMAMMIGGGMAISGWVAQKATRNPLASPDILTVPAAASLGVMFLLWFSSGSLLSSFALPLAAAGSGAVSAILLFTLVGRKRGVDGSGLLLVGIAMSCLLSAGTFFLALNTHPSVYSYSIAWLAGSLGRASWDYLWLLLPGWWFTILSILLLSARIEVLTLEDPLAAQLGVRPDRWRRIALCLSAALAAVCVGVGGNFGFLGFLAPHVAGHAFGSRASLTTVAATGALLLLAADALGSYALPPAEIPAGIVVAMLGAPAFIIALVRRRVVTQG